MTGDEKILGETNEIDPIKIGIGNGNTIECNITGSVLMSTNNGGNIKVQSVILVPGLKRTLISISMLGKHGYKTEFNDKRWIIKDRNGRFVVSQWLFKRRWLYYLSGNLQRGEANVMSKSGSGMLMTWHRGLGHANTEVIEQMALYNSVHGLNLVDKKKEMCDSCQREKSKRQPFRNYTTGNLRLTKSGEGFHIDLVGPMSEESFGKKYLLHMVDDYSRCVIQSALRNKSEAVNEIKVAIARSEV